jgi:phosphoserine phosphatase
MEDCELPKAAFFDLDGTLLDSVDLHAIAWQEAMLKFGHDVSFEQVRSQIGKGGDKLIPVFLSADEQRDHGKELEEWRGKHFKSQYLPLVRPFSAVPELLRRVRDAGLQVAVASSAKEDEVEKYLDIAGITGLSEHDSLTSGSVSRITTAYMHRRQLALPVGRYSFRIESPPTLMLGAPFRAGATHVVQPGSIAVAHVHNQVVNDIGEVGDKLSRLTSKTRKCGCAHCCHR